MQQILAVTLVVFAALGGVTKAEEQPARFLSRFWQSEDGLPGDATRAVVQASDGYLWVATAEGLVRFDGVQFLTFDAEPDAILAQLRRACGLFPFSDGSVWIATFGNGLLRWDGRRMASVLPETGDFGRVWQVVSRDAGWIVLAGANVLSVAKDGTHRVISRTPEIETLLAADAKTWTERGRPTLAVPTPHLRDRRGRLWNGLPSGLTVTPRPEDESPNATILVGPPTRYYELHEDREGNIWAATANDGLLRITEARVRMITEADGLSGRTPRALLEDRSGVLWVGTKDGKLNRIADGQVTVYSFAASLQEGPVSALCEDRGGTLWVATPDGSVYRKTPEGFAVFKPPGGLVKVAAIVEDQLGRIFFGASTGLSMLADGVLKPMGAEAGFSAREITTLAVDEANALWIGTENGDLFVGRDGRFAAIARPEDLGRKPISSILSAGNGAAWVTTLGAGLFYVRAGRLVRIAAAEGMPDQRLTCALDDGAGNLWLGSLGGIFRFAKSQLAEIVEGRRAHADALALNRSDGMVARECMGHFQPAGWRRRDGSLCFPTVHGIAVVQPDRILPANVVPPVVIEECRVHGRPVAVTDQAVRVGPGRVRLEFRFAALSFTAPEKVKFRIKLDRIEDEWQDVGGLRRVSYESVPPGNYLFRVVGASGDGIWNETGATMAVVVMPHLWETLWFRAAMAVLGAGLAAGVIWSFARSRMNRRLMEIRVEMARQTERMRIARDLHDDLGAQLTEISLLAGLANDASVDPRYKQDVLPEISAKAHDLACTLDEVVWAVNPRHDTVNSLADYLAAFAAEFLAAAGITARFDVARDLPALALDQTQRHSLFLAVREALNNAVKHSGAREVWLRLRLDGGTLRLTLQDDGRGFDPAAATTGSGLKNMAGRLRDFGGAFQIESASGRGTILHFSVPVHLSSETPGRETPVASP